MTTALEERTEILSRLKKVSRVDVSTTSILDGRVKTVNKAEVLNKLRVIRNEVAKEIVDLETHYSLKGDISTGEANRIMEHIAFQASHKY